MEDKTAEKELQQTESLTDVSPGFQIVMEDTSHTLRFPEAGFDSSVFITAKPAGIGNDEIFRRGMKLRLTGSGDEATGIAELSPGAVFVGKCIVQITDYAIPVLEEGKQVVWKYAPKGGGDNNHNIRLYERFLTKEAQGFRDLIEGFLDYIDGRDDTDAALAFDELKNEHPQLLTSS